MNLITNYEREKRSNLRSALLSGSFHLTIFAFIFLFPKFGAEQKIIIPSLDVSLYDLPPGNLGNVNLTSESPPQKEPVNNPIPKEEPKIKEPPKPKTKELIDPSDAEISKMKKRKEDWTPSAKNAAQNSSANLLKGDFPLSNPGVPGGRGSGSIALDTTQFPYMYYLVMMKNKISENWIPSSGALTPSTAKRTVIMFRVDRSGRIIEADVEESSGDKELDASALRSVTVSSPFPPLPEGFPDSSLGVHFGFRCEM